MVVEMYVDEWIAEEVEESESSWRMNNEFVCGYVWLWRFMMLVEVLVSG